MRLTIERFIVVAVVATCATSATAFFTPPNSPRGRAGRGGGNRRRGIGGSLNGNAGGAGPPQASHADPWAVTEPPMQSLAGMWNDTSLDDGLEPPPPNLIASGASASAAQKTADNVVKGSQATIASSANYWKDSFQSVSTKITQPFQSVKTKVASVFKSKEKRQEEALMEQLKTMPVKRVEVPNSSILPTEVVQLAARRSGILGNPLRTDRVQDFAKSLKTWYSRKGYILHSVTGATLKPESATAEITVQEPRISKAPVEITFCKEMVVDDETGELLTFRKYKDKHAARKTFGHERIDKQSLNTTFVQTSGRTKPSRIATAMKLRPGRPFCWDGSRWQQISTSGIFSKILKASPEQRSDGTVQLHIYATEAPPRHLEYGLGKSLYTNSWEGELDFEHVNLLGGGETLGVTVRRGTKDAEPSVRLRYADEKFGLDGGYDVEVFSDFIGDTPAPAPDQAAQEGEEAALDYDHDALLDRRGATFRLQNPISSAVMSHSVASASIERTATKTGLHENIGSATLGVGPFVKHLPFDARSNIDAKITSGTRFANLFSAKESKEPHSLAASLDLKPYSTVTATTKQILPLGASSTPSRNRPVVLALRHSVTTSTKSLPRHEARALGNSNNIRGDTTNGRVSHALVGTTELRIPVTIPVIKGVRQDAGVVVFGDWLVATKDSRSSMYRKSCVGVGLRKSMQGIPLKCDITYSPTEGKLKTAFGLGMDFDV